MKSEIERLLPEIEPESTLYVADENLRVVYTNDEWRRFAKGNSGEALAGPAWNTLLLDNMSGKEKERWASIYRLLLDGRIPHYEEAFLCSSPQERRVYRMRITPTPRPDGGTWLVHHTVRVDDKPAEHRDLKRRLKALDADPDRVAEEYRAHVLERRIEVPGFRAAQHLEPLDDVGGDVLWHRQHAGGVTDVVHADVMGHGTEAGIHATKMVAILDAMATPALDPQAIVEKLNKAMLKHRAEHESAYATGIFFRFGKGETRYVVPPAGRATTGAPKG